MRQMRQISRILVNILVRMRQTRATYLSEWDQISRILDTSPVTTSTSAGQKLMAVMSWVGPDPGGLFGSPRVHRWCVLRGFLRSRAQLATPWSSALAPAQRMLKESGHIVSDLSDSRDIWPHCGDCDCDACVETLTYIYIYSYTIEHTWIILN